MTTKFTSVDTLLAKLYSELRGTDLNESDIIGWIGESLSFMQVPSSLEEDVAYLKVTNHESPVPEYFQMAIQLARYTRDECIGKILKEDCELLDPGCEEDVLLDSCSPCKVEDLTNYLLGTLDTSERPNINMGWQYIPWQLSAFRKENFTPIRLSNHSFFNSVVCTEEDIYSSCKDEYTIVGTVDRKFRFSFREGYVALSYLRSAIDAETGYPLIPDNVRHISAANYYVRWKIAERKAWDGREGFYRIAEKNEALWLKYVKQAKNNSMLPKGIDDHQDLLEQTYQLIPQRNRYYGFFGKLNEVDKRRYSGSSTNNKYY